MDYQVRSFANFLILFSIVGVAFIFGPLVGVETRYQVKKLIGASFNLSPRPLDYDFDLVVPKIEANSKVFKNVDPTKYDNYIKALRQGVAHAAGTGYPGTMKNTFIFAHSAVFPWEAGRVNPTFFLLNKLENSDLITVYYQGKRYDYKVFDKKIVNPNEVDEINHPGNKGLLILQTCWPAGTTFKRLLIYAKPV